MSNESPFSLPPVPLMPPDRARYVARAYKSLADNLREIEPGEAAKAERQSQWWLTL